jgi:alpha-glucuronidase
MGVQYVTWMRQTWDSLGPSIDARRFSEVKAKLATHEADAGDWRDTCVNYWKGFSGRDVPVDDGPLSIKIVINGKTIGGFDLSASSYRIPVAAGVSPRITKVIPAHRTARYEILSQAADVPGQAVVKVTKDDFFGPIVKNYVFTMERDTA